jgi:hypothetical protein
MRKKTAKAKIDKSEFPGKIPQASICSSFLGISPNSQGISTQSTEQQNGDISVEKQEIEDSILGESAKYLRIETEFSGESSQSPNSFDSQPKSVQLQRFPSKPQISSIAGIPPKERHRYRVTLGDKVLGDFLTLDEAIALANKSTHL